MNNKKSNENKLADVERLLARWRHELDNLKARAASSLLGSYAQAKAECVAVKVVELEEAMGLMEEARK